jgi:general secretion pathway protein G
MTRVLRPVRDHRGFTLIELLIVVAVIGILTAIGFGLYTSVDARARVARAQADVRTIASAVMQYAAHTGTIPTTAEGIAILTTAVANSNGQVAGPFLGSVPRPPNPGGWPANYTYLADTPSQGNFVVCAAGDSTVAHNITGSTTCP